MKIVVMKNENRRRPLTVKKLRRHQGEGIRLMVSDTYFIKQSRVLKDFLCQKTASFVI